MSQMPRQLQAKPMAPKDASFPGIDVGHHGVEDAARLQPLLNFGEELARRIHMLENIEAGNHVEAGRQERCLNRISYKNFRPGSRPRALRRRFLHLDAVELPRGCFHRAQETAGAAAYVQQRPAGLVLRNHLHLVFPAAGSGPFPRHDDGVVVVIGVVVPHLLGLRRARQPDPAAGLAAHQAIPLLAQMKAVGRNQQFGQPIPAADQAGSGLLTGVCGLGRHWLNFAHGLKRDAHTRCPAVSRIFSSTGLTHFPLGSSYVLISFAGFPAITLKGGKLCVTTALAPTTLLRPRFSSPELHATTAPIPSQQLRPIKTRPPLPAPGTCAGFPRFEISWLWSMIRTEGASSTSASRMT